MRHNKRSKNQGYTLVELIIVIAIMGVLSAMSMVTLHSIDSAKYKQSVSTFESELTTLRSYTIAQSSKMAMRLYKDDATGRYYIERGYMDGSTFQAIADKDSIPDDSGLGNSAYYEYSGVASPISVMKKGSIASDGTDSGILADVDSNGVIIQYNKSDGSYHLSGSNSNKAVTFQFLKKNGEKIADVHVTVATGVIYETY